MARHGVSAPAREIDFDFVGGASRSLDVIVIRELEPITLPIRVVHQDRERGCSAMFTPQLYQPGKESLSRRGSQEVAGCVQQRRWLFLRRHGLPVGRSAADDAESVEV